MKEIIDEIIKEIVEDIKDRRGLKGVWNSIDEDIQEEIKCVWGNIISDKIVDLLKYEDISELVKDYKNN